MKSTKTRVTPVESMEGRGEAKGKLAPRNAHRTQGRDSALTNLERVGRKATKDKETKFSNLMRHLKVPLLKQAYQRLKKEGVPCQVRRRFRRVLQYKRDAERLDRILKRRMKKFCLDIAGSAQWCAGTTTTTECQRTIEPLLLSIETCSKLGTVSFSDETSELTGR